MSLTYEVLMIPQIVKEFAKEGYLSEALVTSLPSIAPDQSQNTATPGFVPPRPPQPAPASAPQAPRGSTAPTPSATAPASQAPAPKEPEEEPKPEENPEEAKKDETPPLLDVLTGIVTDLSNVKEQLVGFRDKLAPELQSEFDSILNRISGQKKSEPEPSGEANGQTNSDQSN